MKQLLCIIIIAALAGTGCSKKEGCTNSSASNYCSDCEKDDGSCSYTGNYLSWWKQPLSDSCIAHGIVNIQFFIDGVFQGTLPVSAQHWNSAPGCSATGTLTITKTWTGSTQHTYSAFAKFIDAGGNVLLTSPTGSIILDAKGCKQEEITW